MTRSPPLPEAADEGWRLDRTDAQMHGCGELLAMPTAEDDLELAFMQCGVAIGVDHR